MALRSDQRHRDLLGREQAGWRDSPVAPLFTAPAGQPITTAIVVSSGATPAGANTIMLAFGTGMRTQFTNAAPVAFESTGALYGVWDWNMSAWNANSSIQYAALRATGPAGTGLASPYTLTVNGTPQTCSSSLSHWTRMA